MSFILEALKKSESDRQRHSGPALYEVRVAPPRSRWPTWAIALGALLAVNLAVICWLMLRTGPSSQAVASQMNASQAAAGTGAVVPAPQPAAAAGGDPAARQDTMSFAPPPGRSAAAARPATTVPSPLASSAPAAGVPWEDEPLLDEDEPLIADVNPEDYLPAVPPPSGAPQTQTASTFQGVRRGTESGLPTYEDVATTLAGLPELRLDLHVYADDPKSRFVFLNMRRMREGDALPEGVQLESITADGAVLSYRGTRFVLPRD